MRYLLRAAAVVKRFARLTIVLVHRNDVRDHGKERSSEVFSAFSPRVCQNGRCGQLALPCSWCYACRQYRAITAFHHLILAHRDAPYFDGCCTVGASALNSWAWPLWGLL